MDIEFVNHSSLLVSDASTRLLMDFWQEGTAFDDSWKLLCEPEFDYERFADVTHIWFSHEHPDHFSPGNIKRIPVEYRRQIVVLFQRTVDKRVVSFCRKAEFRDVIELDPGRPYQLSPGFRVTCAPFGSDWGEVDSWMLVETPGGNLLNINDCEMDDVGQLQALRDSVGTIDVLAVQFSYASKQGERDDASWPLRARANHLAMLGRKVSALRPVHTVPFASFVYWCHVESRYLNRGIVRVHDAADSIHAAGSVPVVLYPGDRWQPGAPQDNAPALARYAERYDWCDALPDDAFIQPVPVEAADLVSSAAEFLRRMQKSCTARNLNPYLVWRTSSLSDVGASGFAKFLARFKLLAAIARGHFEPVRIYVDDHQAAYEFSVDKGLSAAPYVRADCEVALGSGALRYCFAVAWGGETLQINGRFDDVSGGGWARLREVFFLARRMEQGGRLPRSVFFDMLKRLLRRTRTRAGLLENSPMPAGPLELTAHNSGR